jgi:hypothetical protein
VQAVVSEQKENVEPGRIRDFLRMVQGSKFFKIYLSAFVPVINSVIVCVRVGL